VPGALIIRAILSYEPQQHEEGSALMFETLFGSEMPLAARFFIAFLIVLALIGLTAWLVRRFGASRLGTTTRGRQPRLAVIDAATVDGRRRLVLIRRDNIEHLLMIGGPTDLVVEPNIVRVMGREPARVGHPETGTRHAPAGENGWPLQPVGEPTAPASRPYRPTAATEEPWVAPEPGGRARPGDSLTGLAAELSNRLNPPDHAPPVTRMEPTPRAPSQTAEPATAQADHSLAEMAQQLEAALRRAPAPEGRPPVTDPLAAPGGASPGGKTGDTSPRPMARDFKGRLEPKFEPKQEPKFEPKAEPKFEPKPEAREPAATPGKNLYENLEEEMASLLGRPPGKS
jgi:flagellar protein FliO/FliZ